jgi:hypothetical protein
LWKLACLETNFFFKNSIDTWPSSHQVNKKESNCFSQNYVKSGTKRFSQKCENYPTLVVFATLSLGRTINEHKANCKLIIWNIFENMYIWLYLYFLIKSLRMNIEIRGHMNTLKWVFSTFFIGPYEKFHPKKHLPFCEFFGHGQIIACGKTQQG